MVQLKTFEVEKWMDEYETTPGVLNVAETCVSSMSIDELKGLWEGPEAPEPFSTSTKLTYGPIRGSDELRQRLAGLYSARTMNPLPVDSILITPGGIAANHLVFYSFLSPGDHVVCMYPTYQQLYSVPESLGVEVSKWELKREDKFVPSISVLKTLLKENTKMIIINNPNNPTGAVIPKSVIHDLVDVAMEKDLIILSDEVYRPIFHGISPVDEEFPPSLVSTNYSKAIVTGSLSKAYSLAGIRVGWITVRDPALMEKLAATRQYTNISVSRLDDAVASYALSPYVIHALLGRNIKLAKENVALLDTFVAQNHSVCSWAKPTAGTTAFIQFQKNGQPIDDVAFCKDVLEKAKVLLVPGKLCFGDNKDFPGYVRFGYCCDTEVLKQALEKLGAYLRENLY